MPLLLPTAGRCRRSIARSEERAILTIPRFRTGSAPSHIRFRSTRQLPRRRRPARWVCGRQKPPPRPGQTPPRKGSRGFALCSAATTTQAGSAGPLPQRVERRRQQQLRNRSALSRPFPGMGQTMLAQPVPLPRSLSRRTGSVKGQHTQTYPSPMARPRQPAPRTSRCVGGGTGRGRGKSPEHPPTPGPAPCDGRGCGRKLDAGKELFIESRRGCVCTSLALDGPASTGGESLVQETRLRRPRSRSVVPGTSHAGTVDSMNPFPARHE